MNVPGVEPLTREEREALMRWATTPENAAAWPVESDEAMRWEMTVRAAEARIEALQMQMLFVSEGIVTTILIENGGDPDYPDVGPDLWTESTRVLVRELSRIERVAGALPPTPFRWVEMLRAWEAESQASGDYSVTRTPESAGDE